MSTVCAAISPGSMSTLPDSTRSLESSLAVLVRQFGMSTTLESLAEVCYLWSDRIPVKSRDRSVARQWERTAKRLEDIAKDAVE